MPRVEDELLWHPCIDGNAIAVSVERSVVTLRGTVRTFREKRAAANAARRVDGVKQVLDDLDVVERIVARWA